MIIKTKTFWKTIDKYGKLCYTLITVKHWKIQQGGMIMNTIWLKKPNGYNKHILLADNPVEIGNSARLSNGYFDEDFVAMEKSDTVIADGKYVKVKMQGQDTKTFKDVYYKAKN